MFPLVQTTLFSFTTHAVYYSSKEKNFAKRAKQLYTYLKHFEKEQYMLNSVKKIVNKEEIKHLLSSKKYLLEIKNYHDNKIRRYTKEIIELHNSSNKTNDKTISTEIKVILDILQVDIEESERFEHLIDEIDIKLISLGYN
jgi:hypothetical protein